MNLYSKTYMYNSFSKMSACPMLKTLVSLMAIVLLILFLFVPVPLKMLIAKFMNTTAYGLNTNGFEKQNYTLYSNGINTKLIVVFQGVAFLYSSRSSTYGFLNALNLKLPDYDIIVFDYPVRFQYTVRDTLLCANKTLSNFLSYQTYHAIGFSAGTLLGGTFIQKESLKFTSELIKVRQIGINFKSFTGICGLYDCAFDNPMLSAFFKFYIMRGTKNAIGYSCYGLTLPKLIIGSSSEFLYMQTYKYISLQPCEYKIHYNLNDTFPLLMNLPEAQNTLNRVAAFILKCN